jgi:hypothetical protein
MPSREAYNRTRRRGAAVPDERRLRTHPSDLEARGFRVESSVPHGIPHHSTPKEIPMKSDYRSAFQQQVIEQLVESKAINLEAVGATFSKFGQEALLRGETLVQIINRQSMWACGWPGPELDIGQITRRQAE